VTAKPEPLDPGAWVQGLFQSRHSASHVTPPEFTDPDFAMNAHGSRGPIGSDNYSTGYSEPEIDAAIRKAAGTIDEQERVKAYHDVQRLVLQRDPAWVNYFAGRDNNLSQPYVRGLRSGIGSLGTYYTREFWLDK
jgi:ABC-type transport system substrate-binding protein